MFKSILNIILHLSRRLFSVCLLAEFDFLLVDLCIRFYKLGIS